MTGDEQSMNGDFNGQDPFSAFKDFWGGGQGRGAR